MEATSGIPIVFSAWSCFSAIKAQEYYCIEIDLSEDHNYCLRMSCFNNLPLGCCKQALKVYLDKIVLNSLRNHNLWWKLYNEDSSPL